MKVSADASMNGVSQAEQDTLVANYLKERGYDKEEQELLKAASSRSLAAFIKKHAVDGTRPATGITSLLYSADRSALVYEASYESLQNWVEQALDQYKVELSQLLFPIFVHCYLSLIGKNFLSEAQGFFERFKGSFEGGQSNELMKLASVNSAQLLKENELANLFLQNRYRLSLSRATFDLLVNYLGNSNDMVILALLNQYFKVEVTEGAPAQRVDSALGDSRFEALVASDTRSVNQTKVYTGMPIEEQFETEITRQRDLKRDLMEKNPDDAQLRQDVEDMEAILRKVKHLRSKSAEDRPPQPVKFPPAPLRTEEIYARVEEIMDASKRVQLSAEKNPSIVMYTLFNASEDINTIQTSPNSKIMVAGFDNSSIKVFNLAGEKFRVLKDPARDPSVRASKGPIEIEHELTEEVTLIGHSGAVYATDVSFDSTFVLSASRDRTIRLWSLQTMTNVVCFQGHNFPVWDVKMSPLGTYFASASHDRTARIWHTESIYPLRILAGHRSDVDCVAWHPNCNYIATGSTDRTARLWSVNTGECVRVFSGHTGRVTAITMSDDGRYCMTAGSDLSIIMWDMGSGKEISRLKGHDGDIYSLATSKESSLLASGGADNTVRLWDLAKAHEVQQSTMDTSGPGALQPKRQDNTFRPLRTFPTKSTPVYHVSFTNRNILLAGGVYHNPASA
eukprot:Clim_evm89s147 gene=Clim_evmTU89s147